MSNRLLQIQSLRKLLETEEGADELFNSNHGTANSFNNHGNGKQDFSRAKINS